MKNLLLALLAIAAISLPVATRAGGNVFYSTSNGQPSPQMQAAFQIMEQSRVQLEQLHAQARAAMLTALSPAHRNLLAQVFGQLAISANPDLNAAARTLDASLSQSEGRSILSISSSLESQTRQIMEAAHQQIMNVNPKGTSGMHDPQMGGPGIGPEVHVQTMSRSISTTDPGMMLLVASLHPLEPRIFMRIGSPTTSR